MIDQHQYSSALTAALPMTEEEAAAAVANAITESKTYTIYKGMDSALPSMVLLHAWGVAPMRLAVYHRGRCRRRDGRPIMVRPLDQAIPKRHLSARIVARRLQGSERWPLASSLKLRIETRRATPYAMSNF